jgi:hypothetical protein
VVLFTLTFQPLAAALVSVRNVWFSLPSECELRSPLQYLIGHTDTTVQNLALIGLNQNSEFSDLTCGLSLFLPDHWLTVPFSLLDRRRICICLSALRNWQSIFYKQRLHRWSDSGTNPRRSHYYYYVTKRESDM